MMAVGKFAAPAASAVFSVLVTSTLLLLVIKRKPFLESEEEAGHWSGPNQMSIIAFVCQLIMLAVGMVSIFAGPIEGAAGVLLSLIATVPLFVPLVLTGILMRKSGKPKDSGVKPLEDSESTAPGPAFEDATLEDNSATTTTFENEGLFEEKDEEEAKGKETAGE